MTPVKIKPMNRIQNPIIPVGEKYSILKELFDIPIT